MRRPAPLLPCSNLQPSTAATPTISTLSTSSTCAILRASSRSGATTSPRSGRRRAERAHAPVRAAIAERAAHAAPRLEHARTGADARQAAVSRLIQVWTNRGHLLASIDPLGLTPRPRPRVLDLDYFGLTPADLDSEFFTGSRTEAVPQAHEAARHPRAAGVHLRRQRRGGVRARVRFGRAAVAAGRVPGRAPAQAPSAPRSSATFCGS